MKTYFWNFHILNLTKVIFSSCWRETLNLVFNPAAEWADLDLCFLLFWVNFYSQSAQRRTCKTTVVDNPNKRRRTKQISCNQRSGVREARLRWAGSQPCVQQLQSRAPPSNYKNRGNCDHHKPCSSTQLSPAFRWMFAGLSAFFLLFRRHVYIKTL